MNGSAGLSLERLELTWLEHSEKKKEKKIVV